ncbi:MAG TPA: hypothetical protein PLX65_08590, partial [Accumulibacter sp.]|nr:hypothetical protein [Accumulibacter sp.]
MVDSPFPLNLKDFHDHAPWLRCLFLKNQFTMNGDRSDSPALPSQTANPNYSIQKSGSHFCVL